MIFYRCYFYILRTHLFRIRILSLLFFGDIYWGVWSIKILFSCWYRWNFTWFTSRLRFKLSIILLLVDRLMCIQGVALTTIFAWLTIKSFSLLGLSFLVEGIDFIYNLEVFFEHVDYFFVLWFGYFFHPV